MCLSCQQWQNVVVDLVGARVVHPVEFQAEGPGRCLEPVAVGFTADWIPQCICLGFRPVASAQSTCCALISSHIPEAGIALLPTGLICVKADSSAFIT